MRLSRLLATILVISLSLFALTGCSSSTGTSEEPTNTAVQEVEESPSQDESRLDYDAYKQFLADFIDSNFPEWGADLKEDFLNRLLDRGIYELPIEEQDSLLENELSISSIRYNSPTSYPDIFYKDAFEYFFVSPKWSAFDGTQSGSSTVYQVIQFEGQCTYKDKPADALIQFMLDDEGTLQDVFLSVDDIPKSQDELNGLLQKVFESFSLASKKASPVN